MFHYCSCLISVLVSLQNYFLQVCRLVATPIRIIITPSMQRGHQQIVRRHHKSKIRVTKTRYPYGTQFGGLGFI